VKVHKGTALIAGAAAIALALTACSSSGGNSGNSGNSGNTGNSGNSGNTGNSSSSGGSGTVIFGESTDYPENLQPLIAAGNALSVADLEINTIRSGYQVLPSVKFAPDPNQLEGTPTSKLVNGQQVVEFKINPKAVWADGQPITSADYVMQFNTLKSTDPKKGGCPALLSTTGYDRVQTADAVDAHTVKITFKKGQSFPDWLSLLAPMSKHIMDKGSAKATCDYITKGWPVKDGLPLGVQNGPFILQPSGINTTNKTFLLTPNPKYWGPQPKLARLIDAQIGSDADTNVKALQNGEVNMVNPQPQLDLVANLDKLSNVKTQIDFGLAFEHIDFNTKDPLLAHKEVRQAIAYAIDRPALVNATVGKFSDQASVLGNHLLVTNQPGYEDHSGAYAHQDIAKAKQLLESIGCKMGSNGYYTLNGKPLAFAIETTQQNPLRDQTVATIASQVKAAGIKITEDANAQIFGDSSQPHSLVSEGFQIALFAWVGSPAISSNRSIYLSPKYGQQQNYTQAGTPQIDAALNKMSTSINQTDETKWANEADKLLWQQMYTLPLYQKPELLAYSNNISGVQPNPTNAGPLWNSEDWSVSAS